MYKFLKSLIKKFDCTYRIAYILFLPINKVLSNVFKKRVHKNSVLHISYMVHVPYYTVQLLKQEGMKADYLALGTSFTWNKCDFNFTRSGFGFARLIKEMVWLWRIVAKYEILHLHFMLSLTETGWDLPILKSMGRKIVIHFRGCEIRDPVKNIQMHPKMNICQQCDYNRVACSSPAIIRRKNLAQQYGDIFLVATPDLKDFAPKAFHFPLFSPDKHLITLCEHPQKKEKRPFKIVHATNHPGIEGTAIIQKIINNLILKGYSIKFVFLRETSHQHVLEEFATADLSIGKMKMGYYANAQIESLFLGIPTITYVRPEFVTEELENSGFILSSLEMLEQTLEYYLTHPHELQKKRNIARSSVEKLHSNKYLIQELIKIYRTLSLP
jgi:hypothetical protein